jgi:CBS domain-containing protein
MLLFLKDRKLSIWRARGVNQIMQAKEVMTTQVIAVREDQTKQQAARLLSLYRVSGLPVVSDDNMVIGVVTQRDVLGKDGQRVRDIMTRAVISVTPDTDLDEVSRILVYKRIRRVLVLDQGRLAGIISRGDLVEEIASRWVCPVCGEIIHSMHFPEVCNRCGASDVSTLELVAPGS